MDKMNLEKLKEIIRKNKYMVLFGIIGVVVLILPVSALAVNILQLIIKIALVGILLYVGYSFDGGKDVDLNEFKDKSQKVMNKVVKAAKVAKEEFSKEETEVKKEKETKKETKEVKSENKKSKTNKKKTISNKKTNKKNK